MSNRHAELVTALRASPPHDDRNPDRRTIQCPAAGHPDTDPSARYSIQPDGTILLYCWSRGCAFADMLDGLGGFDTRDAFPPDSQRPNGHAPSLPKPRVEKPSPLPEPHRWDTVATWQARSAVQPDIPGPLHIRQEARNADGTPVLDVRKGKVRKRVTWPFGTLVNDLALYGSWALPADGAVVIVEGEKAADAVRVSGFAAVGTYGTSYTPTAAALEPLRGREVVLWPDADAPGREHMDGLTRQLAAIASSVRMVPLPEDAPAGWDAADADHATIVRLIAQASEVAEPTLAEALAAVETFLRRFVVFGRPEAVVAVVLWLAHTYALDYADATPYLAITSPEKGSGKTRLQECLRLIAHGQPGIFIIPTAATIYRMLEADPSTPLLLDELDAVFRDRSDKYEEVRALINAGHRRGATVPRTVTVKNRHEVHFFPVFGPKALAGIGKLPDTVADRSIPIQMLKRKRTETVAKFRGMHASREAEPIARALEAAIAASPPAREADVPDELPDRAADAWEPLLALADAAGGSWPVRARRAAVILHADRDDDDSLGLRMLSDTRLVFGRLEAERLATAALIEALKADEESPWVDDHKPLTPERLARYLRPFGIRSKQLKVAGIKVRGFERAAFVDSWERYLPEPGTPRSDPVPRYPERAASTEVPGWNGGTGLVDGWPAGSPLWDEALAEAATDDDAEGVFEALA